MSGGSLSEVQVTLRNPINKNQQVRYYIEPYDNTLAHDWILALMQVLKDKNHLEKNFCFLGFPNSPRDLNYLCGELNSYVLQINKFNSNGIWQQQGLDSYIIEDWYAPDVVRYGDEYPYLHEQVAIAEADYFERTLGYRIKHQIMNRLHNHFERLQGNAWKSSDYYKLADYETKYAIRQLNIICHEIENLVLSQHKMKTMPEWVRPSQITTFLHTARYNLKKEHKELTLINGFDRKFGVVYMHWGQIGKTLFEVFRDENSPALLVGSDPTDISIGSGATCEAITALKYYTGEFDVEWGNNIMYGKSHKFHDQQIDQFMQWLTDNNIDSSNADLCLGYLPIGQINLNKSFGTTDADKIRKILSQHLDIYKIEVNGIENTFDYSWTDTNYKNTQIDMMKPGYDYSSRRG